MAYDFDHITVSVDHGVAVAVVDHPPINLISFALFGELASLAQEIEQDDDVRVLVLKSANPDFFLAHFDVAAILEFPTEEEPTRQAELSGYHQMCEQYRTMLKVTIAQIEGRVGGGGSELSANFDMRFGVIGKTKINQMEVPLGILPGGSGTQRLPRLIGRARAMEVIMGGDDLDAETAERWGYLNRIFAPSEIDAWVSALAHRIASFPVEAIRAAKASVNASDGPLEQGLIEEAYQFQTLLRTDSAPRNMRRFLEIGGQTAAGEAQVNELNRRLGDPAV